MNYITIRKKHKFKYFTKNSSYNNELFDIINLQGGDNVAKLHFKHFIDVLDACKKNKNGLPKVQIPLDLLDFIALNHIRQNRSEDFLRITEETRARKFYGEKPTPIPTRYLKAVYPHTLFKEKELFTDMKEFLKHFKKEMLVHRLRSLIKSDIELEDEDSIELLGWADKKTADEFLTYLFIDIVRFRGNDASTEKDDDFFSLEERIEKDFDNEKLLSYAKEAISIQNYVLTEKVLYKMKNHIYLHKALVYLSKNEILSVSKEYRQLFHNRFTQITNDRYRKQVIVDCLQQGYFKENKKELLQHFEYFKNNLYIFETLEFMIVELGLNKEIKHYQNFLTNRRYQKYLRELI